MSAMSLSHGHATRLWTASIFLLTSLALLVPAGAAQGQAAGLIRAHQTIELAAPGPRGPVRLTVQIEGRVLDLELEDNHSLLALLPASSRHALTRDNRFLSGQITGRDDSWVRLNWVDGHWNGGIYDGIELYLIDHAGQSAALLAEAPVDPAATIVYRYSDLVLPGLTGHDPILPGTTQTLPAGDYAGFVAHLREVALLGEALFLMPVTIVSDTQFTATHAANTAAVVAGRMNFVDGIFGPQLGTGIALWHHEVLTDNGPLTSTDPSTLLTQFRQFMSNGAGSSIPFGGLAHLFTGRSFGSSVAGIAYLGVLCNTGFGYGVDRNLANNTTSSLVVAHELGHNFNAPHDGQGACSDETFQGIMNPVINGSQQFSDCSLNLMGQAVANAACLVENPSSDLIFADRFEA